VVGVKFKRALAVRSEIGPVQLELAFERRTGRPRLQWTTAQDGPLKGTPREAIPQCAATAPPKTSRVPPTTTCSSSPGRV